MNGPLKKRWYRDTSQAKIAGVCAGIAEYFGIETWLVRILTISAFLLVTGPFTVIAYVVLWAALDKKSDFSDGTPLKTRGNSDAYSRESSGLTTRGRSQNQRNSKVEVKDSVWRAGQSPKEAFKQLQQKYNRTEHRLRKLEGYVTSNEFQLNRELSKL